MVRNPALLRKFEDKIRMKEKLSYRQSLKLLDSMWKEAVRLRVLPSKDTLEGLDGVFRIAKAINSCLKKSSQR